MGPPPTLRREAAQKPQSYYLGIPIVSDARAGPAGGRRPFSVGFSSATPRTGPSLNTLHAMGLPISEAKAAGWSYTEVRAAGYSLQDATNRPVTFSMTARKVVSAARPREPEGRLWQADAFEWRRIRRPPESWQDARSWQVSIC